MPHHVSSDSAEGPSFLLSLQESRPQSFIIPLSPLPSPTSHSSHTFMAILFSPISSLLSRLAITALFFPFSRPYAALISLTPLLPPTTNAFISSVFLSAASSLPSLLPSIASPVLHDLAPRVSAPRLASKRVLQE